MNGLDVRKKGLKTGYRNLDDLIDIGCGVMLIRSLDTDFISKLALEILVRNYEPGKNSLYLHWVDYHKRYWTIDYDYIAQKAKSFGYEPEKVFASTYIIRSFSRDNVECNWNWEISIKPNFVILDSLSELYQKKEPGSKSMIYSIGKFVQLCIKNECPGIIFDYSRISHNYAEEISSIILELDNGHVKTVKHPLLGNVTADLNEQQRLWRWVC